MSAIIASLLCLFVSSFVFVYSDFSRVHGHMPQDFSHVHGYTPQHKHYIVYMGHLNNLDSEAIINFNHEIIASITSSTVEQAMTKVVHHYHKSLRGFSAMLSPEEADKIRSLHSVVSVFESPLYELQTTRSYDFLLEHIDNKNYEGIFEKHRDNPEHKIIIGHLDGGIWPESSSFDDNGFEAHPKAFGGDCYQYQYYNRYYSQIVGDIPCNKKIIGTRFYWWGYNHSGGNFDGTYFSARDDHGHGTHTISTASGVDVSFLDFQGNPTVIKGGAPKSYIASYKVCWNNFCDGSDVFKAYDDAIYDGVDLITLSLGPTQVPPNYFEDPFALASYHAFSNGILTVAAAGNQGDLGPYHIGHTAPWVFTVAATSTDRDLSSDVILGNGVVLKGHGHNTYDFRDKQVVWANGALREASDCSMRSLDRNHVKGKIVVCKYDNMETRAIRDVLSANGIGIIFADFIEGGRMAFYEPLPYSMICPSDYQILRNYINSNKRRATASILSTKIKIHSKPAPQMAYFSSRGPSSISPDIIKPDIAAPGMSILAAFPSSLPNPFVMNPVPITNGDRKYHTYMSGTSMACPHVTGIAAVLKGIHANWPPSWIKSALMTTATWNDNTNQTIRSGQSHANPFDMGSGLVVPGRVFSPGLVYDMTLDDVNNFVCNQAKIYNYDLDYVRHLFGIQGCYNNIPPFNLNYPSIALYKFRGNVKVTRRLTLATLEGPLVYKPVIDMPESVRVEVSPDVLDFTRDQVWEYCVTFENVNANSNVYGSITWTDGHGHDVKTPIALII
ncbi:Subtilisin-like serine-protease S [Euphorbia peplus]|nr:Subtilisin-like serine-protease S [Euphorbia peplus]